MHDLDFLAYKYDDHYMRDCLVTGYRIQHGHNVSHANNKTKRVFLANVFSKYILSEIIGKVKVSISHRGERTIDKYGGLDQFLLTSKSRKLTLNAKILRKQVIDKVKKSGQLDSLPSNVKSDKSGTYTKKISKRLQKKIIQKQS